MRVQNATGLFKILAWYQKNQKKITISWTGTALILMVPCIGGPGDIPQSCICISVLATKICRDNWLYHVHTLYMHAHTLYRHVHSLYMGTTYFMHVPLSYIPLRIRLFHLHHPTYNASVQESALLYMQGSYRDVLPKNGCGRWSAFL